MAPPPPRYLRLVLHAIVVPGPVHEEQDREGDEEEYAVHDAEREARFLHGAIFFDVGGDSTRA